jgi:hypothetical protein
MVKYKTVRKNIFDKFRLGQKFQALCPVLLAEPEFRLGKKNDVIFEVLAAWNNFTPPKCAAISVTQFGYAKFKLRSFW